MQIHLSLRLHYRPYALQAEDPQSKCHISIFINHVHSVTWFQTQTAVFQYINKDPSLNPSMDPIFMDVASKLDNAELHLHSYSCQDIATDS